MDIETADIELSFLQIYCSKEDMELLTEEIELTIS